MLHINDIDWGHKPQHTSNDKITYKNPNKPYDKRLLIDKAFAIARLHLQIFTVKQFIEKPIDSIVFRLSKRDQSSYENCEDE